MALSEWSDEILFPMANAEGYRLIFESETWLRRICVAALVAEAGAGWATEIDPKLRKRLESYAKSNSDRWYLGMDADDDIVWSTTHGQLADLLRLELIQKKLLSLSGVGGDLLARHLLSISQVRNTLAHNRAISDDTMSILRGDIVILRAAWTRFKTNTLYDASSRIILNSSDAPDDLKTFAEDYDRVISSIKPTARHQLFLAANENFVSIVRLPSHPFGTWPNARKLHEALSAVRNSILCVMANKSGDEIQILFPRRLPLSEMQRILETFVSSEVLIDAWTDVPPEMQHPASVCWPKLWFYENRRPDSI